MEPTAEEEEDNIDLIEKETMGLNSFKANCICDAGATEEIHPTRTVKDEVKEKILMSAPTGKRRI